MPHSQTPIPPHRVRRAARAGGLLAGALALLLAACGAPSDPFSGLALSVAPEGAAPAGMPSAGAHVLIDSTDPYLLRADTAVASRLSRVDFLLDGEVIASDDTRPFEHRMAFALADQGEHELVAVAHLGERSKRSPALTLQVRLDAPPVAEAVATSTDEDHALAIELRASDAEGAALSFEIVDAPAHGALSAITQTSATTARVSYTPAGDYHGADAFSYRAHDGVQPSEPVQVALQVASVEDLPVARDLELAAVEDTALPLTLEGYDGDGDALAFELVDMPQHGQLTGVPPQLTYTPNADFFGTDAFTFRVNDGDADSVAVGTVTLRVAKRGDPPVATAQRLVGVEDQPLAITLGATDPDSPDDALFYEVTAAPKKGTLSGSAPDLVYTPAPDANGADFFEFKVLDEGGNLDVARIDLDIAPVNDAPVPTTPAQDGTEDVPFEVTLTADDVDGDPLQFLVNDPPTENFPGTVTRTGPATFAFAMDEHWNGELEIGYSVADLDENGQMMESVPASFILRVEAVNDAPVAAPAAPVRVDEDERVTVTLAGSDVDGDALTFRVLDGPTHGSVSAVTGVDGESATLVYAPEANYFGADAFTFVAHDGELDSQPVTVELDVQPVNDAPTITAVGDAYVVENTGPVTSAALRKAFTVADIDDDLAQLVVTAASSDQAVVADADLLVDCDAGACTLDLTATRSAKGSATITLTVDDRSTVKHSNLTDATAFTLTVGPRLVTSAAPDGAGSLLATLAASEAWDVVGFAADVRGTLAPARTVVFDRHATLEGPGASELRISGADARRVLDVENGVEVVVSGVTVGDGLAPGQLFTQGGAIENRGTLTLRDAVVADSVADSGAGIANDNGELTLERVTLRDNAGTARGGGLFASGVSTVLLIDTRVEGNTAQQGAGLYNYDVADFTVRDTVVTLNGNNDTQAGGGIFNEKGTVTLRGSTVTGNDGTSQLGGAGSYDDDGSNTIGTP